MPQSASAAEGSSELPLFPLGTVLFPGGPLPLRIFETRYTDMVRKCMRDSLAFGVVLIHDGGEVGEVAGTAQVGTSARIGDFYQLPDGLLGISCLGERRFRLQRAWRQADGLNIGAVDWLPETGAVEIPERFHHLAALLRKVLPELGAIYEPVPKHFDDAGWVGSRLAEILPISQPDKQYCLELDDPLVLLERLAPLIRRNED